MHHTEQEKKKTQIKGKREKLRQENMAELSSFIFNLNDSIILT